MRKYLMIILVLGLGISACSAGSTAQPADPAALTGAWQLTAYGPADSPVAAVPGVEAGLTFETDGRVSANAGCNGIGGEYTVEGDQITFGEIVSTLMACDDPIMEQEAGMIAVLTGSASYQIDGETLTITNNDRVLVLTRGRQATGEPATSLTGAWSLVSYGSGETLSSPLADVKAGVTFEEDGTVTGTSGCNDFGGQYSVQGEQITFHEIVSTLKLCDAPLMGQEEAMYQVLAETAAYQIDGRTLTITNQGRVLVFTR